jgi:beta-glucosidase
MMTRMPIVRTLALCAAAALANVGYAAGPQPWLDTSASFETRAAALVAQMSLEEKAAQMQNAAPAIERLGVPAYDWWNEGLHGVARSITSSSVKDRMAAIRG